MYPASFKDIKEAAEPRTAAKLCVYVRCVAWMSAATPRFAERSALIHKVLEEAYHRSGRRTKNSLLSFL